MERLRDFGLPLVIMGLLMGVWEAAHRAGALPKSVASPADIWSEFTNNHDILWFHLRPTLTSAAWGFLAAALAALALTLLAAFVNALTQAVYTGAVIVASIPLIALTPILVLWLNRGAPVTITVAAVASFFPILIGAMEGLRQVTSDRAELFRVLSANRWQNVWRLQVPSAVPLLVAGLRAAAAGAVLGAIIAEWSGGGGSRGIGTLMATALFGFNVPLTWLTIVATVVLSIAAYVVVGLVTKLITLGAGYE